MARADVGGGGGKQMETSERVAAPRSNHFGLAVKRMTGTVGEARASNVTPFVICSGDLGVVRPP